MNIIPSLLISQFFNDPRKQIIYSFIFSSLFICLFCLISSNWNLFGFCVIKYFFEIECPGCGVTRGLGSLLRLDINEALSYNPSSLAIGLALLTMTILCLLAIFNPKIKEENILRLSLWVNKLITSALIASYFLTNIKIN